MENIVEMENIVKKIAEALVDLPDVVSVTEVKGANTTIIKLHVAPMDTGKIIGKQGLN